MTIVLNADEVLRVGTVDLYKSSPFYHLNPVSWTVVMDDDYGLRLIRATLDTEHTTILRMNLNMDVFTLRILIDDYASDEVKATAKGILIDAAKQVQAQSNLLGSNKLDVSLFYHPAYETAREVTLDDPQADVEADDEIDEEGET